MTEELVKYSRIPLIRTTVIRIGLALPFKHFLLQLYVFYGLKFPPNCQVHIRNYVLMFYLYVNKYVA